MLDPRQNSATPVRNDVLQSMESPWTPGRCLTRPSQGAALIVNSFLICQPMRFDMEDFWFTDRELAGSRVPPCFPRFAERMALDAMFLPSAYEKSDVSGPTHA